MTRLAAVSIALVLSGCSTSTSTNTGIPQPILDPDAQVKIDAARLAREERQQIVLEESRRAVPRASEIVILPEVYVVGDRLKLREQASRLLKSEREFYRVLATTRTYCGKARIMQVLTMNPAGVEPDVAQLLQHETRDTPLLWDFEIEIELLEGPNAGEMFWAQINGSEYQRAVRVSE